MGLNDAETLPQVFADLLGRKQRVLNLAFPAYGPQQFLAEMQTGRFDGVIGAQPRLFIFMTAAPWHAARTACKPFWRRHVPRYALENGQLAIEGRLLRWLEPVVAGMAREHGFLSFVHRALSSIRATHEDVDLYIRILVAAVNLAKEKYGVATLIPYIPAGGYLKGTGFSDDEIVQRLRDGGAIVMDVSLATEDAAGAKISIRGDGRIQRHWRTASGRP